MIDSTDQHPVSYITACIPSIEGSLQRHPCVLSYEDDKSIFMAPMIQLS